jgi:hypothetical protein
MKKGKLQTKDGSEFTVYYHKPPSELQSNTKVKWPDEEGLNELDVSVSKIFPLQEWPESQEEKIKNFLKDDLNKFLKSAGKATEIMIDDSLESDVVREPVVGRLYKIKGLNKIAKLDGHSIVEGVVSKRYYKMSYLDKYELHIPTDYLLKPTELEIIQNKGYYE